MKIKEMFRTRRNKDHLEVVFVDMERAEDVLTVRFFPVEDRENSLPDVQVNIGVVNGALLRRNGTPPPIPENGTPWRSRARSGKPYRRSSRRHGGSMKPIIEQALFALGMAAWTVLFTARKR